MALDPAAGHSGFSHDSIRNLGYDWSKMSDPSVAARPPFKVYLPRTATDVACAVREARELGQQLTIRGSGHSSNDLVLAEGGHILHLVNMSRLLAVDLTIPSVTVQAGAALTAVDEQLAPLGLGLPVVGDHRDLTVGGFASVGGVGPTSHCRGLFVDNIQALEYVTPDGEIATCSRDCNAEQLYKLLAGCGKYGIITAVTLDAISCDKGRERLHNERRILLSMDAFLTHALDRMAQPGAARLQRGYWMDAGCRQVPLFGQWSDYIPVEDAWRWRWQRRLSIASRRSLGRGLSQMPEQLARMSATSSLTALALAPRCRTTRDVEQADDFVLDYSTGGPVRWFVAWPPLDHFDRTFRRLNALFCRYRATTGCFTYICILIQAIRSQYLGDKGDTAHSVIAVICGVVPSRFTAGTMSRLVAEMDDICLEEGAFRYQHSPTSRDIKRLRHLDPNYRHRAPEDQPCNLPSEDADS
ncbi:FAD-binding oxidoreductase [Streptomyces sp. NPDC093982]|uniref:FAD-binding oxidoreductase n=1 Tax=Streptomyces sp. NPDC093982 TaxID=3155077 RepID=UPI00343BAE26